VKFEIWSSRANRFFFGVSFVLLAVAVVEKIANLFHASLLGNEYSPGRLLEFAAIALLFVIALLLRGIREELRRA
jgi:hypothetical protein